MILPKYTEKWHLEKKKKERKMKDHAQKQYIKNLVHRRMEDTCKLVEVTIKDSALRSLTVSMPTVKHSTLSLF